MKVNRTKIAELGKYKTVMFVEFTYIGIYLEAKSVKRRDASKVI